MTKHEIILPEGMAVDEAAEILREYGSTENPAIASGKRIESLREQIAEVKELFAAALAEESPQSADALARQDMDVLVEPFVDSTDRGTVAVDTHVQTPETGAVDGPLGGSVEVDLDTISLDEREQIQRLAHKRSTFESRGMDARVDALEGEICAIVGADDYDEIEGKLDAL